MAMKNDSLTESVLFLLQRVRDNDQHRAEKLIGALTEEDQSEIAAVPPATFTAMKPAPAPAPVVKR